MSQLTNLHASMANWCKIQANNFAHAVIGGSITIDDSYSGENFCGNAGLVTGKSVYENLVKNKTSSSSSSQSSTGF